MCFLCFVFSQWVATLLIAQSNLTTFTFKVFFLFLLHEFVFFTNVNVCVTVLDIGMCMSVWMCTHTYVYTYIYVYKFIYSHVLKKYMYTKIMQNFHKDWFLSIKFNAQEYIPLLSSYSVPKQLMSKLKKWIPKLSIPRSWAVVQCPSSAQTFTS